MEERLSALEKELRALKQQGTGQNDHRSWIENIACTFTDDPDFEEIV